MPLFQCGASLLQGLSGCGQTQSAALIYSQTHLLQYSEVQQWAGFLWGVSGSHYPVIFCLGFWTVKTPKSKCDLTQHHNLKEQLNEIDSGVLKSQVWFHIVLTSASTSAISSRQTRSSSTFTVTSAREESVETNGKKFSCSSSQAFCFCQNSIDFSADFIGSFGYC